MGNGGIFDEDILLTKLSELGDSLVKLDRRPTGRCSELFCVGRSRR